MRATSSITRARSAHGFASGAEDSDELALDDARRAVDVAHSALDTQVVVPVLSTFVLVSAELSRLDEAAGAGRELVAALSDANPANVHRIIDAAWVADRVELGEPLRRFVLGTPAATPWREVVLAALDGEFELAAGLLRNMGHVDEALARLRAGERLVASGRTRDGEAQLRAALTMFRPLGAMRYVSRAEKLLAEVSEVPA